MKKYSNLVPLEELRPLRVRFTKGPSAASLPYWADEMGFAHVKLSDYSFEFFTSTIDKLGPLFKDESIGEPMPMLVEVMNFDLCLQVSNQPLQLKARPHTRVLMTRDLEFVNPWYVIPATHLYEWENFSKEDNSDSEICPIKNSIISE